MSKSLKAKIKALEDGAKPPSSIPLSPEEQWSNPDDLPTVESVVETLGLQYLGTVDTPPPLIVPPALLDKIRYWDREWAALGARRQEYLDLAIDILSINRLTHHAIIDIDTGVVTLSPREDQPA